MKKITGFLFLTFFAFLSLSCKKETDAQMLSSKLQEVIKTEKVERVVAYTQGPVNYNNAEIAGDYGSDYKFEHSLVTIEGKTYNLAVLQYYEIATISSLKCLVLYF